MNLEIYLDRKNKKNVEIFNGENLEIEGLEKLVPNTIDASEEKHIPSLMLQDDNVLFVQVGSTEHPMEENHYIESIYVVAKNLIYKKVLKPGDKPELTVSLDDIEDVKVYAYCNLHGLWVSTLK